jgi:ATP-binding cassette subfamily C protein CydD
MARETPPPGSARSWLKAQGRLARAAAAPVLLLGCAGTAAAIGQAWCVGMALGGAIETRTAPDPRLLAGFAGLAVLRAAMSAASERLSAGLGSRARRRLRSEVLGRLLGRGPAALRAAHSAELAAVAVDRIDSLDGYFARYAPAAVLAMVGPLLVAAAALAVDPAAAGVLCGAGLLVPVGMAAAGIGAAAASRKQFVAMQRLQTRFLDRVRGIATIVLHGRAEDEAQALAVAADELRVRTMRVLRVAFLSSATLDLSAALALVVLALRYGAQLAGGGLHRPGVALFVLLLTPEFFAPLRAYAAAYQDRFSAASAADALAPLVDASAAAAPPGAPPPIRTIAAQGLSIAFEDVSFAWDAARGPTLDRLSFRVASGDTVVLAGPSGAGKSTVIELLLGFVQPQSGRILFNGADIADVTPQALSGMTAWIGQRPVLFAASIRDNIRFARPEATDAEVEAAAAAARLTAMAASLPLGLDTLVGEGGYGLSGGQAQRVAVARAFLRNAPLLLLDEPTAHLDPATEAEVLDSLKRLTIGRTVILASHSAAAHAFGGRRIDLRDGRVAPIRGAA